MAPRPSKPRRWHRGQAGGDWQDLPRTEAVARMLAEAGEPLSPSELSRRLQRVGRDDPPLAVGKALDHLHRKNQADTIERAKWVLTGQDGPRAVPPTTDVSQEPEEVRSDQEMSPAVLAFTGDSQRPVTKEKPGFWTRRRVFEQVRRGSNIQLLSFSLVSPLTSTE